MISFPSFFCKTKQLKFYAQFNIGATNRFENMNTENNWQTEINYIFAIKMMTGFKFIILHVYNKENCEKNIEKKMPNTDTQTHNGE